MAVRKTPPKLVKPKSPGNRHERRAAAAIAQKKPAQIHHLPVQPMEGETLNTREIPLPESGTSGSDHSEPVADKPPEFVDPHTLTAEEKRITLGLSQYYNLVGMMAYRVNEYDGAVIVNSSEECAKSLVVMSRHFPKMRAALVSMTESNDYFAPFLAHGSLILLILLNHNVVPKALGSLFGKPPQGPTPEQQRDAAIEGMLAQQRQQQQAAMEQQQVMQAMAQAYAMQQQQAYSEPLTVQGNAAGFDPLDTTPRDNQNPAAILGMMRRD